jgi:GxxExxY protein
VDDTQLNVQTSAIIGCAMKVHTKLGFGFLESVYENALTHELRKAGFKAEQQVPIKVYYDETIVGDFFADAIVNDTIIIELKAVERLNKIHEVQLVNYLNASARDNGLLFNFGAGSLEFKRKFRLPKAIL